MDKIRSKEIFPPDNRDVSVPHMAKHAVEKFKLYHAALSSAEHQLEEYMTANLQLRHEYQALKNFLSRISGDDNKQAYNHLVETIANSVKDMVLEEPMERRYNEAINQAVSKILEFKL